MKTSLLLLVLTTGMLAADDAKDAAEKDIERLQGTWVPASVQFSGRDVTNDNEGQFKLVFKGDQATVEGSDAVKKEYAKLTMKLDPSTSPKCLDIVVSAGDQKDVVMEGIYELKGDELKICAKIFGKGRPGEFASAEGSNIVLAVLKREKQ
jgi:uncharacterized protein (TIGR03067 family)